MVWRTVVFTVTGALLVVALGVTAALYHNPHPMPDEEVQPPHPVNATGENHTVGRDIKGQEREDFCVVQFFSGTEENWKRYRRWIDSWRCFSKLHGLVYISLGSFYTFGHPGYSYYLEYITPGGLYTPPKAVQLHRHDHELQRAGVERHRWKNAGFINPGGLRTNEIQLKQWNKPLAVRMRLREHRWVVWADWDVRVVNASRSLGEFIGICGESYDLILPQALSGSRYFANCVFMLRAGEFSSRFLDRWLELKSSCSLFGDQSAFQLVVLEELAKHSRGSGAAEGEGLCHEACKKQFAPDDFRECFDREAARLGYGVGTANNPDTRICFTPPYGREALLYDAISNEAVPLLDKLCLLSSLELLSSAFFMPQVLAENREGSSFDAHQGEGLLRSAFRSLPSRSPPDIPPPTIDHANW